MLTPILQRRMMEESGKMIVDSSERLGVVAQSLRELVVRPSALLYHPGGVSLTTAPDLRREGPRVRGGRGPGEGERGSGGSQCLKPREDLVDQKDVLYLYPCACERYPLDCCISRLHRARRRLRLLAVSRLLDPGERGEDALPRVALYALFL